VTKRKSLPTDGTTFVLILRPLKDETDPEGTRQLQFGFPATSAPPVGLGSPAPLAGRAFAHWLKKYT